MQKYRNNANEQRRQTLECLRFAAECVNADPATPMPEQIEGWAAEFDGLNPLQRAELIGRKKREVRAAVLDWLGLA